jgi:hydrogenase maturation factor
MSEERPVCREDVCATCADLAEPGTVVGLLDDDLAVVRGNEGLTWQVSIALVTARIGDVVLVHAGEAIAVLPGEGR